jgi:kumamolisin
MLLRIKNWLIAFGDIHGDIITTPHWTEPLPCGDGFNTTMINAKLMSKRKSTKGTTLAGSRRNALAGARVVGDPNPNETIGITVLVRSRNPENLETRLGDVASGLTTGKTRTTSREEFESLYGADPEDLRRVMEFAQNQNLTVIDSSIPQRQVRLTGTIDSVSKAFNVKLQQVQHEGKLYRMRVGPIEIPSDLKDIIVGVLGIDNRRVANYHSRSLRTMQKSGLTTPRAAAKQRSYDPVQLAKLYNYPNSHLDGSGQCIALIELGGFQSQDDLNEYFSNLGSPVPTVTAISVDGANYHPGEDPGADGEVMLDIIVAGAMAPKSRIAVYYAPNTDAGFLDAITKAIHDKVNAPSVISISWGGPESGWTEQSMNSYNQAFAEAAVLGITVCAAAGDDCASDLRPPPFSDEIEDDLVHVDFPSSSPYVLSCGGTRLNSSGSTIKNEVVWNDSPGDGGTGGGVSDFFPVPPYQKTIKIPPSLNTKSKRGRGVPDVCADASPMSGYKVRVDGKDDVYGGTSAVAPAWAALIARLNQKLGKPIGFFHPLLYRDIGPKGVLRDIITGDNTENNIKVKGKGIETIKGYSATKAWDACTGWGSPDGMKLLGALTSGSTR